MVDEILPPALASDKIVALSELLRLERNGERTIAPNARDAIK